MSSVLDLSLPLQSSSNVHSNVYQSDVLGVSDCSSSAYWNPAITPPNLDFLPEGITLPYPSENTQCITGSTTFDMDLGSIQSYSANHRDSNTFEEQTLADSNNSLLESESEQNSISKSPLPTSSQDQSFDSSDDSQPTRKRKRSLMTDRMLRARICSPIPKYEVKMSRTKPDQQKAIEWLSGLAKHQFDKTYESFMRKWGGVESTHTGTCVLCPEDWRSLSPAGLASLKITNINQLPTNESPRLTYQYSDHVTTFARAVAWFRGGQWPRPAGWIDNFIGCGPFEPMDASHLCHQKHCMVHLYYESAKINHERESCAEWARDARQKGADVPPSCSKHEPPCLLQVGVHDFKLRSLITDICSACCFGHFRGFSHTVPRSWCSDRITD